MTTFETSCKIPAPVDQVFAAFQPERLKNWWGPAGFTNTFHVCEFKTGGRWSFIMHGPDGKNYPNENIFVEVEASKKVVIQHVSEPKFRLTITLTSQSDGTDIFWSQAFENDVVAQAIKHIVVPANDQNLERMSAEVLKR